MNDTKKEGFDGLLNSNDNETLAHFQYKELWKRLSDITNSSSMERKGGVSTCLQGGTAMSNSGKRKSRTNKLNLDKTDRREPLKEKTQEIVNQQVLSEQKKKRKSGNQGVQGSA